MKSLILSKLSFGIEILMAVHSKGIVLCCLLKWGEECSDGRDWSERLGLFAAGIKVDAIIEYFDHILE